MGRAPASHAGGSANPNLAGSNPIILTLSQPILALMPSTWLGSDKYQFLSHWFNSTRVQIGTSEVRIPRSSSMLYSCSLRLGVEWLLQFHVGITFKWCLLLCLVWCGFRPLWLSVRRGMYAGNSLDLTRYFWVKLIRCKILICHYIFWCLTLTK